MQWVIVAGAIYGVVQQISIYLIANLGVYVLVHHPLPNLFIHFKPNYVYLKTCHFTF